MLLSLLVFSAVPVSTGQEVRVQGQTGQSVTLTLKLPDASTGVLLNRDAPNIVTLKTPWSTVKAVPDGKLFQAGAPAFEGYFQRVHPILLKVPLPAGTKSGLYQATLKLQLFTCDKKELICKQRDLVYPVTIAVNPSRTTNATLSIPASEFRRKLRF